MKSILAAFVFGLALLQPALAPALAQVNLNPPYGDAAYDAFTVLSPDAPDPEAARKDVIVVFHGFTSALPNGTYKRVRKFFKKTHTVIGVNYDPLDIDRTLAFLDTVGETWLKGRNTTVFGTSLGAFWAELFGKRIGAQKIVLLNPVTEPRRQLSRYIGKEKTNKRRVQTFRSKPRRSIAIRTWTARRQRRFPGWSSSRPTTSRSTSAMH